ncbi:MAG: hypothetical protein WC360_08215, partial [Opitutales bacterium]
MKTVLACVSAVLLAFNISNARAPWLDSGTDIGDDWKYCSWFGIYYDAPDWNDWIYHETLGYMWVYAEDESNVWLYDMDYEWIWTSADCYPFCWSYNDQDWLWYNTATTDPALFYSYRYETWKSTAHVMYGNPASAQIGDSTPVTTETIGTLGGTITIDEGP